MAALAVALPADAQLRAGEGAGPEDGVPVQPPARPDGEPVEVSLGVYLIQVSNLDQIL